jgi:hypothetical protein
MRYRAFPVARIAPRQPSALAQLPATPNPRRRLLLTLLAAVVVGGGLVQLAIDDRVVATVVPDEPAPAPATSTHTPGRAEAVDALDAAIVAMLAPPP